MISMRPLITMPSLIPLLLAAAADLSAAGPRGELLANAPSRFTQLGAGRVHCKTLGQGAATLMLVHGWSCNLDFWRLQAPASSARLRLGLLDLPGHGQRDARVDKAVLAGHSLGTPVICRFYRDFPAKTAGLIAVDGGLRGFDLTAEQKEKFLGRFQAPDYRDALAGMVMSFFSPGHDALRDQTLAAMQRTPQPVRTSVLTAMLDKASWEPPRSQPPLLVVNAPSPLWSDDYVRHVRQLAPHVDCRVVAASGHFVMLEQPAAFNAAGLELLAAHKFISD